MTNAQVQHYIPKFLLRRFGSGKKDQVHVFDKHTDRRFTSAARKIAAQKAFYDFDFKGSTLTLEPSLAALEGRAAKRIEAIIRDRQLYALIRSSAVNSRPFWPFRWFVLLALGNRLVRCSTGWRLGCAKRVCGKIGLSRPRSYARAKTRRRR